MNGMTTAEFLLLASYVLTLGVICVYGLHRYHLVYLFRTHRQGHAHVPVDAARAPRVTVQLPMYNEAAVAARVIDAACRIDYPADRLQIQVLDDSTDPRARALVDRSVEAWRAQGVDIELRRREDRTGYKAGALAEGSATATGELIAIFDADFVPPPDLLHKVVGHFTDEKVGMVQVRWDHLNRDASLLTKGQAIFLDGHFVIEHTARNRSGRFMHFNGTAGVWRRQCIAEAGGWEHDTLTEDLDLSYRAQLKGWQFVYLPQHAAPAELPPEMLAFKAQAHRWTKGSMQTAKKLLPRVLQSKTLPAKIKTEAFFHLTNTIVYPFVVVLTVLMYPSFIYAGGPLKEHPLASWLFGITLFAIASCSASVFFVYAQTVLFGTKKGWRSAVYLPYLMALGIGMSINNTRAVLEALFEKKGKDCEFVRTPKYASVGRDEGQASVEPVASAAPAFPWGKLLQPAVEVAFGLYTLSFIAVSVLYSYSLWSLPFMVLFAYGYLYVGGSSVAVLLAQWADRRAVAVAPRAALS